jgi:DNA-binding transcriptional LysR family regulator
MSLSIDMLAAFVKVADTLNVSAAALELGTSKSVVSKRIAQLETQVRATLFSRSTRKIALTPAGAAYLDYARRALAEVTAAQEQLRGLRSDLTGQIRVTAPVSWGQRVLAKQVPQFLHQHPHIEIELLLVDRMMDLAYERMDIALRWSAVLPADMAATPIAQVPWVIAASPAYLAGAPPLQTPNDLTAHPCMSYWRESSDDAWTLTPNPPIPQPPLSPADEGAAHPTRAPELQVRVHSRYHANNPEAVADAALAGLGVAMLPRYLCEDALQDGHLVALLPGWLPKTKFGSLIYAVAAPERLRIARNQAFLKFLGGQEER